MTGTAFHEKVRLAEFTESDFGAKVDIRLKETFPDLGLDERKRRVGATLNFLNLVASNPGRRFAPSRAVDDVWHEMVVHTADYREFCAAQFDGFIDHTPFTTPGPGDPTADATIDAFASAGVSLSDHSDLWVRGEVAKCCGGHYSQD